MSDTDPAAQKFDWLHFLIVNVPYVVLYAISIWLVGLTNSDEARAAEYWQLFIPLVGLVSTLGGWRYAGLGGVPKALYLFKQVLHWGALLIVINLLFMDSMLQFLNAEDHGFVVIYLLGLAAILSGIYLDWKMAVFGAFLVASAIGLGYIEDNLMMMLTISSVALAGVVVTLLVRSKIKQKTADT